MLRSGVANVPKLATWASPHACTVRPVTGVDDRSMAMIAAPPAEERERRLGHAPVADRHELRDTRARLLLEHRDRVAVARFDVPVAVRRAWDVGPPGASGVA